MLPRRPLPEGKDAGCSRVRAVPERRKALLRRDLNDLVRGTDGKVSEAKAGILAFKGLLFYTFLHHSETILKQWEVLSIFVTAFLVPDALKRILEAKAGVKEK